MLDEHILCCEVFGFNGAINAYYIVLCNRPNVVIAYQQGSDGHPL